MTCILKEAMGHTCHTCGLTWSTRNLTLRLPCYIIDASQVGYLFDCYILIHRMALLIKCPKPNKLATYVHIHKNNK